MKIKDVILRRSEIEEGISQLFIAERDFSYKGLPVLKDSLVYYNGKNEIAVNIVGFGIFQDRNVPDLVRDNLPLDDDDLDYVVDNVSTCEFEITRLGMGATGVWHGNHFHDFPIGESLNISRLKDGVELKFGDISFSSLWYRFDTLSNSLSDFISVEPVVLQINANEINLPSLLEICKYQNSNSYDIIPLNDTWEYKSIKLQRASYLSEVGVISGSNAEDFNAEIIGHQEYKEVIVAKGKRIEISCDGTTRTNLPNNENPRGGEYQIIKV